MSSVTPSVVREFIEERFPEVMMAPTQGVPAEQAGLLRILVRLVDQIPPALTPPDPKRNALLQLAVETIRDHVLGWETQGQGSRGYLTYIPGLGKRNAVVVLHDVLGGCPENAASDSIPALEFLQDYRHAIEHPFFASVLAYLDSPSRSAWHALVSAATGGTSSDSLAKKLLKLRNKVAFHYDPNAICVGYEHHFLGPKRADERAFVSRGASMRKFRFYFADAAATGYLLSLVGGRGGAEELMRELTKMVDRIKHALFAIVDTFIQQRRYAYQEHVEDN